MKSKKTIAIDIDDVLAAHAQTFVDFSNEKYGTRLKVDDYSDHWGELWQVDIAERERRANEFLDPNLVGNYSLIADADKALARLARGYQLVIVTARSFALEKITWQWLEKHFKNIFATIRFVPMWTTEKVVSKAEICREIGADYLIDDSLAHCTPAAKAGIKTVLFGSYTWNQTRDLPPNVKRAENWQAVLEYFDAQS